MAAFPHEIEFEKQLTILTTVAVSAACGAARTSHLTLGVEARDITQCVIEQRESCLYIIS